jgi:hypothetical protein
MRGAEQAFLLPLLDDAQDHRLVLALAAGDRPPDRLVELAALLQEQALELAVLQLLGKEILVEMVVPAVKRKVAVAVLEGLDLMQTLQLTEMVMVVMVCLFQFLAIQLITRVVVALVATDQIVLNRLLMGV